MKKPYSLIAMTGKLVNGLLLFCCVCGGGGGGAGSVTRMTASV